MLSPPQQGCASPTAALPVSCSYSLGPVWPRPVCRGQGPQSSQDADTRVLAELLGKPQGKRALAARVSAQAGSPAPPGQTFRSRRVPAQAPSGEQGEPCDAAAPHAVLAPGGDAPPLPVGAGAVSRFLSRGQFRATGKGPGRGLLLPAHPSAGAFLSHQRRVRT